MNVEMPTRVSNGSERHYSQKWRYLSSLGTLGLVIATPSIAACDGRTETVTKPQATSLAPESSSTPTQSRPEHQPLNNLRVLIINHPGKHHKTDTDAEEARQVLHRAGQMMSDVTDGALWTATDIPIYSINHRPTGTYTSKNGDTALSCFSGEDIEVARERSFNANNIPLTSRTAIIVNGEVTCREIGTKEKRGAAAWAGRGKRGDERTVYAAGFNEHLVVHEEGHVEGITHASTIDCRKMIKSRDGSATDMAERSQVDIADLLQRGCDAPRNEKGEINAYTDYFSVMGSGNTKNGDIYNYVQINQLNPRAAIIEDITPDSYDRVLSLKSGEVRGLRIVLPDNHPLRTIDASIQYLNVGLESIDEDAARVRLVASGAGDSYALDYAFPYEPSLDAVDGKRILYVDKALGITISAEGIKSLAGFEYGEALVSVELIPR